VISVGNLTVGGTGKTPVVIWLVNHLLNQGRRVAVLSRGYKRRSGEAFVLVSDGTQVLAGPEAAGDEPHLIARRCPGAPVAVGGDRYRLGCWLAQQLPELRLDGFVLDDGFQHLAVRRDLDFLLIDASAPEDLEALLPAGRLREPLAAAGRASAFLVTRADHAADPEAVLAPVRAATGRRDPAILLRFRPEEWVEVSGAARHDAGWVKDKTALLFSGIGKSGAFRKTVLDLGVTVADEIRFPDHHAYRPDDLGVIRDRARRGGVELVLTTEKDAGKVAPLLASGAPEGGIWALRIDSEIVQGRERLEKQIRDTALAGGVPGSWRP
jgi:tetraacyldisaccharide 4'-kinase